ncbi:streptomycin 3''-adenylyltransferase [Aspergillus homomorphus CBS 101889]|uniref:Streptomycin 3''-adenylyltransferase n=1 Tax=Aspergillus homomorphus (strain CBS 101889) TaxID=1450537 RepID=A0A395IBT0_ASPHC|nr:streptomycin 3''-adenylyltransferase [Aspergillus homomorphus CBS 101889]RAL17657.1 streptomycin 3''-adenylyltransferase [Aspergillus homomorphus CBS 101889]
MYNNNLPEEVETYLQEIVQRLTEYLKDQLIGVYLFGSASYDAYEPGLSDLDVQAIVRDPLNTVDKQAIIYQLSQSALPCPATKLELVVYAHGAVYPATRHPVFELNLNTGPHRPDHISLDPANESSHWFLIDIAMGRELGRSLHGPDPTDAFGAIPRRWILEAIATSLDWHRANELNSANSVLNACRGWRFIVSGKFSSKLDGAKWALQQQGCPDVVNLAIAARKSGDELPAAQVMMLYDIVMAANRAELATDLE